MFIATHNRKTKTNNNNNKTPLSFSHLQIPMWRNRPRWNHHGGPVRNSPFLFFVLLHNNNNNNEKQTNKQTNKQTKKTIHYRNPLQMTEENHLSEAAELAAMRIIENVEAPVHPHGCGAAHLLAYNKKWAAAIRKQDPDYFRTLSEGQNPEFLYIGCCDSRVVPTEMLGLLPGEGFVHRSIAGLVCKEDCNILAAAQYAVHHLHVHTVIVAGHHRCGGIAAAYQGGKLGYAESYLDELVRLKKLYKRRVEAEVQGGKVERMDCFAELSVIHQAKNLAETEIIQSIWREERVVAEERKKNASMTASSPVRQGVSPTSRFPYVAAAPLRGRSPTAEIRHTSVSPMSSPTSKSNKKRYMVKLGKNPKKTAVQTVEVLGWILVLPSGVVRPLLTLNSDTVDLEAAAKEAVEAVFERYRRPPDHPHARYDDDGNEIPLEEDEAAAYKAEEEAESSTDEDDVIQDGETELLGVDPTHSGRHVPAARSVGAIGGGGGGGVHILRLLVVKRNTAHLLFSGVLLDGDVSLVHLIFNIYIYIYIFHFGMLLVLLVLFFIFANGMLLFCEAVEEGSKYYWMYYWMYYWGYKRISISTKVNQHPHTVERDKEVEDSASSRRDAASNRTEASNRRKKKQIGNTLVHSERLHLSPSLPLPLSLSFVCLRKAPRHKSLLSFIHPLAKESRHITPIAEQHPPPSAHLPKQLKQSERSTESKGDSVVQLLTTTTTTTTTTRGKRKRNQPTNQQKKRNGASRLHSFSQNQKKQRFRPPNQQKKKQICLFFCTPLFVCLFVCLKLQQKQQQQKKIYQLSRLLWKKLFITNCSVYIYIFIRSNSEIPIPKPPFFSLLLSAALRIFYLQIQFYI
eukprot:gene6996-4960_t